jgi:LPS sulfotransferase NodH
VKRALLSLLTQPHRFAVVTRGRTGSHFLLSLLDSHPAVASRDEVVGEWRLRQPHSRAKIDELGVAGSLEEAFRRRRWREKTVGIKFNYYQLEKPYAEKWHLRDIETARQFLRDSRDIRIIHLKRRNRLRTVISMELAARTQQYIVRGSADRPAARTFSLAPKRLVEMAELIGTQEEEYAGFFDQHASFDIYYEDLLANTKLECDRILGFLGVPNRPLEADTVKQNVRAPYEVLENYNELKAYLDESDWRKLSVIFD